MSKIVLLDSRPLGLITHPKNSAESLDCKNWMQELTAEGSRILVPEITDYELRRELLRALKSDGLRALDALKTILGYVPITTEAMQQAAHSWAQARQMRLPTAPDLSLDADVILAAQAVTLNPEVWGLPGAEVVIAAGNVGHLNRFADAQEWRSIT